MEQVDFVIKDHLAAYVNCVIVGKHEGPNAATNIPLYADGYPGIMFQQSKNGFFLLPKGKRLSELFLYGQTLQPVSLDVKGPYRFIVVQLYPFASKHLLNINPRTLNDDCFDLLQLDHVQVSYYRDALNETTDIARQVALISELMEDLINYNQLSVHDKIQEAISIIIQKKGLVKIKELLPTLFMTERTFERNFMAQVGLRPKQFAKIIQFQTSLSQLNQTTYQKLVEVGFDSGFADQSHFIRAFKKYTGQTPSFYLKQIAG